MTVNVQRGPRSGRAVVISPCFKAKAEITYTKFVVCKIRHIYRAATIDPALCVAHIKVSVYRGGERWCKHRHPKEVLNPDVVEHYMELVVSCLA